MRKSTLLLILLVGVCLSASTLGAEEQKAPFMGEVNANSINVRCDSTVASKVICTVNEHDIVEVIAEAFGWYKIRLPKKAICYIKTKYVNIVPQATGEGGAESPTYSDFGVVNADSVNIRLEPNESSCILGRINKKKAINVISKEGDWYKITAPDVAYGWINKKFINPVPTPQSASAQEAQSTVIAQPLAQQRTETATPQPPQIDKNTITVAGIIEPYGKIIGRKGTHKVLTEDKRIYILKGDKRLLNSCSYRKAAIRGKLQEISGQEYPLILVEKIEVLD